MKLRLLISLLTLIAILPAQALIISSSTSLADLRFEMKKIEKAIDLTRKKIKSPEDNQFLPDLFMTLAELLVDKSRMAILIKTFKVPSDKVASIDLSGERRSKLEAIELYKQVENRFPDYRNLDRAVFFQAHEYRELRDYENALQTYKRLTEKFPKSIYWEESKLLTGNIFFDKKDFDFAMTHYNDLLNRENKFFRNVAHYKLGWCHIYKTQWLKATEEFREAMNTPAESVKPGYVSKEFEKNDVREEAMIASVWPVSELSPEDLRKAPEFLDPIKFYTEHAYDQISLRKVMARLGKRMEFKKRWQEATLAHYESFRVAEDMETKLNSLEDYYYAMKESGKNIFPDGLADDLRVTFERLIENPKLKLKARKRETKSKVSLAESTVVKFETVFRDIATTLHKNAQKSKRQDDIEQGIRAYEDYLYIYRHGKYITPMKTNLAELFYLGNRKVDAGILYSELAAASGSSVKQKDYMDSAIQSLVESMQNLKDLTLYEKVRGRFVLREVAVKYLKMFPNSKAEATLTYNVARTYYDERDFKQARKRLRDYIYKYQRAADQENAALLLLDTYYQQDDMKGLLQEGNSVVQSRMLSKTANDRIVAVLKEAQLKRVQSIAGEFTSKDYADKFLQFAKSQKGSELGKAAMLEAFSSMKATNNTKMFEAGEQYLGTYGSTPEAKNVLGTMIKMALATVDGARAANYLEAYADRYPDDVNAGKYRLQALALYETMGMYGDAEIMARKLKDPRAVLRLLREARQWQKLATVAAKAGDLNGRYNHGLALWRLGDKGQALQLFEKVASTQGASTREEKDGVGHAAYVLALEAAKQSEDFARGQTMTPQLFQQKVQVFQQAERKMQAVTATGSGTWSVAALAELARMNSELAKYLQTAPLPKELPRERFNQMVGPQVKLYTDTAAQAYAQCVKVAKENLVLSRFTLACLSQGQVRVNEADEFVSLAKGSAKYDLSQENRVRLIKDSKDTGFLSGLALGYFNRQEYAKAALVYQILSETDPDKMEYLVGLGTSIMATGSLNYGFDILRRVVKTNAGNKDANWALAAIYKRFGLTGNCSEHLAKAGGQATFRNHPWLRELGQKCE